MGLVPGKARKRALNASNPRTNALKALIVEFGRKRGDAVSLVRYLAALLPKLSPHGLHDGHIWVVDALVRHEALVQGDDIALDPLNALLQGANLGSHACDDRDIVRVGRHRDARVRAR